MTEKKPKITVMGEEVPYDELPPGRAVALEDYFKPVRLSPKAIDQASKIIPSEHWMKDGLYTFVASRANFVLSKLSADEREGRLRSLKYTFDYDANGPVLTSITLIPV